MLKNITTPLKKYHVLSEAEARTKIKKLSKEVVDKLLKLQEKEGFASVTMLGIGNSVASGWSAVSNNVNPLINKLDEYILETAEQQGLDLETHSYVLCSHNSNDKIYEMLLQNPSLSDIKRRFEQSFDEWKEEFRDTAFENYVDRATAMQFYPEGELRFTDNFGSDKLTLTFFNGCSGLIMERLYEILHNPTPKDIETIFTKSGRKTLYEEEVKYLTKIRDLITGQSDNSYLTIGNFPYFNTIAGYIVNPIVEEINQSISTVANHPKTTFYDGMMLSFFQDYDGKLKVDNHPTVPEQYNSLVGYLEQLTTSLDQPGQRGIQKVRK